MRVPSLDHLAPSVAQWQVSYPRHVKGDALLGCARYKSCMGAQGETALASKRQMVRSLACRASLPLLVTSEEVWGVRTWGCNAT